MGEPAAVRLSRGARINSWELTELRMVQGGTTEMSGTISAAFGPFRLADGRILALEPGPVVLPRGPQWANGNQSAATTQLNAVSPLRLSRGAKVYQHIF